MKTVQFTAYGSPHEVAACVETIPGSEGVGRVVAAGSAVTHVTEGDTDLLAKLEPPHTARRRLIGFGAHTPWRGMLSSQLRE